MKKSKIIATVVCIISVLSSTINVSAAGYDVISETNIIYTKDEVEGFDDVFFPEEPMANQYSNLISNFSNGYAVVFENCAETKEQMVYYTIVDSSYVIDETGNKVDIGHYDKIGVSISKGSAFGKAILPGRETHFEHIFLNGIDIYGGVIVVKNGKYGYVGLRDGVNIPCEHEYVILRYDENIFGVHPDSDVGEADYYINAKGEKLLPDIDLSPIVENTRTFLPSLKYLGNNMFYHIYALDSESNKSKARYIDVNGNEIQGYTPKIDESKIRDTFDKDALKNYYSYESLDLGDISLEGTQGTFINTDENGKFGVLDKNANLIVPYVYDDMSGLKDGYCWAAKDGKWSLLKIATNEVYVKVNEENVEFDQIPLIINGRTLAPLRAIFEKLGATVEWDDTTKTITSVKGENTITMSIDKNEMYINDKMVWLDVAPQIVGERTLVPVRAIAEAFNCNVSWDEETSTVHIAQ